MQIIKHRTMNNVVEYKRIYGNKEKEEMYFSFNCNENGEVDIDKLHEDGLRNYKELEEGIKLVNGIKMEFLRVERYEQDVFEDAVGICEDCEAKVVLQDPMTNTCECGAEYNRSGQRLADRIFWDGTDGAGSPDYE